jgi:hypothetical protein
VCAGVCCVCWCVLYVLCVLCVLVCAGVCCMCCVCWCVLCVLVCVVCAGVLCVLVCVVCAGVCCVCWCGYSINFEPQRQTRNYFKFKIFENEPGHICIWKEAGEVVRNKMNRRAACFRLVQLVTHEMFSVAERVILICSNKL